MVINHWSIESILWLPLLPLTINHEPSTIAP